ncbi:MAG: penicillin-binding protein 1C, partial [Flavitalea sp.]
CSETGLPPAEFCTNIISDHFIPMVSPTRICEHMKEVFVSMDEKISYCRSCVPDAGYKKKLYNNYNSELVAWFSENQVSFAKIPPHNPACEKVFQESGPVILFPHNGSEYLLSKKNPEPLQLTCNPAADVSKVYWYINNRFYKAAPAGSKQFFMPEEGPVRISCTDDKGRNRDINIRVRFVDL